MSNGIKVLWSISIVGAFFLGYAIKSSIVPAIATTTEPTEQVKPTQINHRGEINTHKAQKQQQKTLVKQVSSKPVINDLLADLKQLLSGGQMMTDMAAIAEAYDLVKDLSESELLSVLNSLRSGANNPKNNQLVSLLIGRLAAFDPVSAIHFIDNNISTPQAKMVSMMSALSSWTKADPISAYHWYIDPNNGHSSGGMFQSMGLMTLFNGLAEKDANDAFMKLTELENSGTEILMAAVGFSQSLESSNDFIHFIGQASELDDSRVKESLITSWVQKNPLETVEWLESIEDTEQKPQLQTKVFQSWMATEPLNAADWYLTTANNNEKISHAVEIIQSWGMGDPKAALNWLERQADFDKSQPIAKLLNSAVYMNINFAIDNLELLSTDKEKIKLSSSIYSALERANSRKAAGFLASSPYREGIEKIKQELASYDNKSKL